MSGTVCLCVCVWGSRHLACAMRAAGPYVSPLLSFSPSQVIFAPPQTFFFSFPKLSSVSPYFIPKPLAVLFLSIISLLPEVAMEWWNDCPNGVFRKIIAFENLHHSHQFPNYWTESLMFHNRSALTVQFNRYLFYGCQIFYMSGGDNPLISYWQYSIWTFKNIHSVNP